MIQRPWPRNSTSYFESLGHGTHYKVDLDRNVVFIAKKLYIYIYIIKHKIIHTYFSNMVTLFSAKITYLGALATNPSDYQTLSIFWTCRIPCCFLIHILRWSPMVTSIVGDYMCKTKWFEHKWTYFKMKNEVGVKGGHMGFTQWFIFKLSREQCWIHSLEWWIHI